MTIFVENKDTPLTKDQLPPNIKPLFCQNPEIIPSMTYRKPREKTEVLGVKCNRKCLFFICPLKRFRSLE